MYLPVDLLLSYTSILSLNISRQLKVQSTQPTGQARSAFYVERATSARRGLREGSMKFSTQNEE
jgi:hypothetical protein